MNRFYRSHLDYQKDRPRVGARGLALLAEFSRQIGRSQSEEETLQIAAGFTKLFLEAGAAYSFTSDQGTLYGMAAADPDESDSLRQISLPLSRHAALTRLYELATPVTLTGKALGELTHHWPALKEASALYMLPLIGTTGCVGALAVTAEEGLELGASEREFLEVLCSHTAIAMEKHRIAAWAAEEYVRAEGERDEFESFVYTASHDLKGPLVSLRSFARLLRTEYPELSEEERLRYVERIDSNARRMLRLVRDLLEYAQAGAAEPERERVDLNALVAEVMTEISDTVTRLEATTVVAETLPTVEGDSTRLREVFRNLLENALAYSGAKPTVEVGGWREESQARLWVRDDGPGIAEDWQERIFKPCVRHPAAREKLPDGSGMGLAIVKRIIEWHGGSLSLESTPGQGATFHFTVPIPGEPEADTVD